MEFPQAKTAHAPGRFVNPSSRFIEKTPMTKLANAPAALSQKDKELEFENIKRRIHTKLVDKLDLSRVGELEGEVLRREIRLVVEHLCDTEDTYLNRSERDRLIDEVLDETFGLGPLEMLLKEPTISEIMINGPKNVYVERGGCLEKTPVQFRDDKHLMQIIDRIVSKVGRRVDEVCPMCDARLPDGSRVNAIIPPLALDGPTVTIRRFGSNPLKLEDLLNYKSMTPEMVMLLEGAMKAHLNIIISGGTGSGKTTLLNTLSKTRPNCSCNNRTWSGSKPAPPTSKARAKSKRPTSSAIPCVCGPIASSSASAAVAKPSTCSKP
jgi:pilus assembly protein CpaF